MVVAAPGVLLLACAALVYRDHLPSQLLVRAGLWSNLILGTLLATSASGDGEIGVVMALATAAGLLALGRSGLDAPSDRFAPVAFRGSLILALVMALADTQSLALFGAIGLERQDGGATLGCAALMLVALVGLYRLELWGLVLNLVANVLIAGLAFSAVLDLPKPIVFALCTTALIQIALPAPLVLAMIRGKAPEPSGRFDRLRAAIVPAVVVGLGGLAILGMLADGRLIHF